MKGRTHHCWVQTAFWHRYRAECNYGWTGPRRRRISEALADARTHEEKGHKRDE